MSAIQELAEFVTGLRIAEVPSTALDQLRLHLFDTLGAAIVGGTTAEGQAVAGFVHDTGVSGEVPAFGFPLRTSVSLAALATTAATRCTEVDDIHLESCTTPGSVIVPAVLALSSSEPRVAAEAFMAALLVGYELLTRFGKAADGPTILYRGLWPTYLSSTIGTAAAASRLLTLTREESAHALATALSLTTGTIGRARGLASRWLTLGISVQNGILAALAARRGFRGDLNLLDGGWSSVTGVTLDMGTLVGGLGKSYEIERVSLKPYCAAKQVTGAIYGFLTLMDEEKLEPGTIEKVIVKVPRPYAPMIDKPLTPTDRIETIVSAQYQLALAAYHRGELRDVRRLVIHEEPEFRSFMERVIVEPDESLERYYPAAWPARVEVRTRSGRLIREIRHTKGDPSNPMSWDEAIEKVGRVASGFVDRGSLDRLARVCRELGASASPDDLTSALANTSRPNPLPQASPLT